MAHRLRRLLFGASHIPDIAPSRKSPGSLRHPFGGFPPAQCVASATAGSLEAGRLSAPQLSSGRANPPTASVLVLIPDSIVDGLPELDFARTLSADVRAVYVDRDLVQTQRLVAEWARSGDGVPLLVLEDDGLPVAASLRDYAALLAREAAAGEIAVVLPVCESGGCRAKIRCVLGSLMARLAFGRMPGVRVYGGGLHTVRSGRKHAGSAVEA